MDAREYQQVLGRRIAQERRRHGLSQPELAAKVGRPVAWVSELERGVQPIDRLSVLQCLADALELPLAELTAGKPAGVGPQRRSSAAEGLRVLLAGAHALCAMLGESTPPALATLRADIERACALARAEGYDELTDVMRGLLPGLEAAVRVPGAAQQAEAWELSAIAYQTCSAALVKLGEPMAAWIAADRAMAAAEKAGNLLLVAAGQYRLALAFLDSREYALANETARTTVIALRGLAELGDPDALSLCGGLTLLRAVVEGRLNHPAAAYGHLAKARLLAHRLGGQHANGIPEFGAQYVALYEIAVSVDLGDSGHALRTAASVDQASLSPGRRVRMLIDVARAYGLRGQVDEATEALARAAECGPFSGRDQDRASKLVRELMAARTPPPAALAALAERISAVAAVRG